MEIVPLTAFRDNYIWLIRHEGCCVVVDPGDAAPVLRYVQAEALTLAAVLITHRHHDHVDGLADLQAGGAVPVFGPASVAGVTHAMGEGDTVAVAGLSFAVWAVPGHTEEHLAYLTGAALFCGDTLFASGCGRLLGQASAAQLQASLLRLAALPPATGVYCSHEYTLANLRFARGVEPDNADLLARQAECAVLREAGLPTLPSRIGVELACNPFLRCDEASVRAAVEAYTGQAMQSPQAVFAALRAWKDVA